MRVAALYDIHGNLPALEAVLQDVRLHKVDQIIVGGDVVLGPMSAACIDLLQREKIPVQYILGNCEVSVLNQLKGIPQGNLPPPGFGNNTVGCNSTFRIRSIYFFMAENHSA